MQDVIFAGTETRKPVNFAEVSLVLDNSSHLFDINYDEVVVTRRLFRSGESVYQINRSNCRLKIYMNCLWIRVLDVRLFYYRTG